MRWMISSRWARNCLTAVETVVLVGLMGQSLLMYLAGRISSRQVSVDHLTLASKLDPLDADYPLALAHIHEYVPDEMNHGKARAYLERAARLSPSDPRPWLEMASMNLLNTAVAEASLRRADYLAPTKPEVHWTIGNFMLLRGNTHEAFRHFRIVVAGTSHYNNTIFDIAWKASEDPLAILKELIPSQLQSELSYLYYLADRHRDLEAVQVWSQIAAGSESVSLQQAANFIDDLIVSHHPNDAYRVWSDLVRRGWLTETVARAGRNLLINGDFEEDVFNVGFSWRIIPVQDAFVGLDTNTYRSPNHSLVVRFSGKTNLAFQHVFQYVKVRPGQGYRLQGFARSEGITANSGPRIEIADVYNPSVFDQLTDDLRTEGPVWTPFSMDFKTGSSTELIIVRVVRRPSGTLDNLIAGRFWLDDLSLQADADPITPRN